MMNWNVKGLEKTAVAISASRRTDIPALFGQWMMERMKAGFADYIPAGPPRRIRRSLLAKDVTHLNFWTKWGRPFFGHLSAIRDAGWPVLWNWTLTGLGGTSVEPNVPSPEKSVEAIRELAKIVPATAINWRYDPIFLSNQCNETHHIKTFTHLCGELAGSVDRVTCSFVEAYDRRVAPDLKKYEIENSDQVLKIPTARQAELAMKLREISERMGVPFTLCCSPDLGELVDCPRSGCNSFDWAIRAYPELNAFRRLKNKPTRKDCGCSEEYDIGVYDTCTLGCRYSYGSCNSQKAKSNFARHDPMGTCILPDQ